MGLADVFCNLQDFAPMLPRHVHEPGRPIAQVAQDVAQQLGLSLDCSVCAGTTGQLSALGHI